jgi:hypothetical protein
MIICIKNKAPRNTQNLKNSTNNEKSGNDENPTILLK